MRILHIHTEFESGGIEAVICNLANEMAKSHDIFVCSIFEPTNNAVYWNKISSSVKKITLGKNKKGFSVKEIFLIYKTIREGHYDVVHMHGCFYYYLFSVCLLFSKIKFVYTIHSDAKMENVSWDEYLLPIKRWFFKKGYVIPVTISKVSQKSFEELYKCNSNLIFNGISTPIISDESCLINSFKKTADTKIFIHAGRITKAKNQEVLCKVFSRLICENYDVVLIIAGTKEDREIWNRLEPYWGEQIIHIGEQKNIPSLLAYSDAMCLPSVWEGLPMVLLEALAVGCIPICSPVGGIVNVVSDSENGILSNSSIEEDFYQAVKRYLLLGNDAKNRMKEECLRTFDRFKVENTAMEYLDLYMKG